MRLVTETIQTAGADVVTITSADSSPAGVLADVRQSMTGCVGVVILGFRQLEVSTGRSQAGTQADQAVSDVVLATPWNHAEAGVAAGLGLPILRLRERGVSAGVFDPKADALPPIDFVGTHGLEHALRAIDAWVRTVAAVR